MQNKNRQTELVCGDDLLRRSSDFLTGYACAVGAMTDEELSGLEGDLAAHQDKDAALRYMHKVLSSIVAQLDSPGATSQ